MMKTVKIGLYNNKGGVAKTTSVINIAYALAKKDKKILVVDCDYQENCFTFFFSNKSSLFSNYLTFGKYYKKFVQWQ